MRAVEELQKQVWSMPELDVVPLSHLAAAIHAGGVLIGAFDGEVLAGFVYGFVGKENATIVHHSHMLAVRPEYRSHDLGFRLKAAQRACVIEQGIEVMTWTFDPLQSLNAYFNFNKLGVTSEEYLVDFYGQDAASVLHRNGTDRLWVKWRLNSETVIDRLERKHPRGPSVGPPALLEIGEDDVPVMADPDEVLAGQSVAIEIPADINTLQREDAGLARDWRIATRSAFLDAVGRGFVVEDFYRTGLTDCQIGTYVLNRRGSPG